MFICAFAECTEPGTVFVVHESSDHGESPLGRLFCSEHSVADDKSDAVTKFLEE